MNEQVFLEFTLNFNLRQTRLNKPTIIYALFSFRGKQYKVNICLLYTSPSPRDS